MIKSLFILFAGCFSLLTNLYGQNILEGVYMPVRKLQHQEKYPERPVSSHNKQSFISLDPLGGSKEYQLYSGKIYFGNRFLNQTRIFLYADTLNVHFYQGNPLPKINKCHYFNPAQNLFEDHFVDQPLFLPSALRYYLDTTTAKIEGDYQTYRVNESIPIDDFIQPFYFRQTEVTNKEYHEFVTFVRDSIVRTILAEELGNEFDYLDKGTTAERLNWNYKINYNDPQLVESYVFDNLLHSRTEKYYKNREWDTRHFNFRYKKTDGTEDLINVYPDTLCWTNDFKYSFNEQMANLYYWHPAYENYPVVGVSYAQAVAFLIWKTEQEQKKINAAGLPYRIEYALPRIYEWEYVNTHVPVESYFEYYPELEDGKWHTDLLLASGNKQVSSDSLMLVNSKKNILWQAINSDMFIPGNFILDGTFHTSPVNSVTHTNRRSFDKAENRNEKAKAKALKKNPTSPHFSQFKKCPFDILHLGSNVSEWINMDYKINWQPIFVKRQQLLDTLIEPEAAVLSQIEQYFNQLNDPSGKLIVGSNWYDERFSYLMGHNPAGARAKVFADPFKSFSTVGFRYVVRVYLNDEQKLKESSRNSGQ